MTIDREFISQVVIVLAVCAGAWMMLVQPKTSELARLERQLSESASTPALASQEGIEALATKFASFKQRLVTIRRRNAVAEDTSSLYATIMRMATEENVRVQALQPTPAKQAGAKPDAVRVARLEMTLAGAYDDVARLIDRVAAIDAFIRPSSLQLIPIDGQAEQAVSARFGCDVLAFTIEETLASVGEVDNAKP